ncbi:MAG: ABC transporter ATP-binding protein [Desulfobacterales bacterium]
MISLTGVTKTYRSGRGLVHALADISLKVPAGGFAAVTGKSGSGKSTLLNCIGGLEMPDQGEIRCFETRINRLAAPPLSLFQRRHLGFVFQRGNLLSYLTVADNIGLPLALNGIVGAEHTRRIEELLTGIGLEAAARAMPHELSSGETQRVSVARAVAHRPRLLLADEPTANLDTASGRQVIELMHRVGVENGCTIIMATHDRDIIHRVDQIIQLEDGKVRKGGS